MTFCGAFGSLDEFKEKISTLSVAQFGSGWAWLSVDSNNKLVPTNTPNQDNPLSLGTGTPTEGEILRDVPSATYAYYFANIKPKPEKVGETADGQTIWRCRICGYEYVGAEGVLQKQQKS